MTDLVRPVPGQPFSDSDGEGTPSTVLIDAMSDVIETNEDAVLTRTSPNIVTTDPYTDISSVTYANGTSTTGWHGTNMSTVVPVGPSLVTVGGRTAVQADLKKLQNDITAALYVNLTEVGYPSGVPLLGYETFDVDMLISEKTPTGQQLTTAFTAFSITLASGVDMTGTLVQHILTGDEVLNWNMNEWHTIQLPAGALTIVRSIGIKKSSTGGAGANSVRYNLTNVKKAAVTPIDQAYYSQASVAVVVPPSYPSTAEQLPFLPDPLKSIVDFRPDNAFISGLNGEKSSREWGLDETGVNDVGHELQLALDSLSPGDVLTMPPHAVYRVDEGLHINVPGLTIDGHGAAIIQRDPIDLYDGVNKVAVSGLNQARIRVEETGDGATIRNLRVFASHITPQLGSAFTPGTTPASTSGTTMVFDAINESASFTNVPGRDYLGRLRQDFVLSDTTHVANDCRITITDDYGVVLYNATIPLLTSTPTVYSIYAAIQNPWAGSTMTVTKATGTANVITLTQVRTYGNCWTNWLNPYPEFGHGVAMSNCQNVTVENCTFDSVTGDGLWTSNSLPGVAGNHTFRNVFVRGGGRHGSAPCGGGNISYENVYLLFAGRKGVDIEPEFDFPSSNVSALDGMYVRNMVIWKNGLGPGGFTVGAGGDGWGRVRNVNVDGLRVVGKLNGSNAGIEGGFMDSSFRNVECIATGTGNSNSEIRGRNVTIDEMRIDGTLQLGERTDGTGSITSGTTAFTALTSGFTPTVVASQTQVTIRGAGVAGADLVSTVAAYIDETHVTLTTAASTTVTGTSWSMIFNGRDEYGVVLSPKGITAKNVLFTKLVNGEPYLLVENPGTHLENVRIADELTLDQTYAVHSFTLLADTTYTGLDLVPHRTLLPNSYPGIAIGQPWFPGGLNMKGGGLHRVSYLSGTTTKGNNLGRFQMPVTAGQTTLTVAFPGKTYPQVTVTMAPTTGGSMALGVYHYRHAARTRGGPLLANADQTVTLTGSNNAVAVNVDGLYDAVTTLMQVEGLTVYRGVAGGAAGSYSSRYDIAPAGDIVAWGGSGTGTGKRYTMKDLGTTIGPSSTTQLSTGFNFPYTAVAGTWTTAAGANAIGDESGFEADTNYAVFVEPSWHTTWRVTARRRDGFDLEFGVPCPTGNGTLSYMIGRF